MPSISLFTALSLLTGTVVFGMSKIEDENSAIGHALLVILLVGCLAFIFYEQYHYKTKTSRKISEMVYCYEVIGSYECNDASSQLAGKIAQLKSEIALVKEQLQ